MKRLAILNGSTIQNVAVWDGVMTFAPAATAKEITTRPFIGRNHTYADRPSSGAYTYNIIIDGNSIACAHLGGNACEEGVTGAGLTTNDYYNVAVSGRTTRGLITLAFAQVDSFYDTAFGNKNILILWEGSNDLALNASSAASAYQSIKEYCMARKALGFKIIVATILPRNDVDIEARRLTVNTSIRNAKTNNESWIDAVADVASDPTIGIFSATSNTAIYYDGVHPAASAHHTLASYFTDALESLL